ncbi:hypothetical protein I546_6122 [Mycobacterium kansasii 732]|nr:hypothetical protein I546_6122 [Mycobacterium kansasii 732]
MYELWRPEHPGGPSVALGQPGSQGESEVAGQVTGDALPNPESEVDGPPLILIIAAVVLAVAAVGVILVIAATRHPRQQPITVAAVPAPHAGSPACHALTAALPQHLGDYQRVTIAQPARKARAPGAPGPAASRSSCVAASTRRPTSSWARRSRSSTGCSGSG